MGWKSRGGRRYFYRVERRGGRVTTTYFGTEESGRLMAEIQAARTDARLREHQERQAARKQAGDEERAICTWFDQIQAVADSVIHKAGYHKHKREWRRKRP